MGMKVSDADKYIDPYFGPDPYFEKLIKTASCSERHLEYMFRIVLPLLASYRKVLVAQKAMTTYTTIGHFAVGDRDFDYLSAGHVLYSDYPGKGKTLLAKVPAIVLGGTFGRFQGAVDAQPSDYTGNRILDTDEEGRKIFRLIRGPAFADKQLADEANRNTPRTLGAFLEPLSEGQVTVFGESFPVRPFVLFTINPIETEGTFALPEALLDRIMFKLTGEWFTASDFAEISNRTDQYYRVRAELKEVCGVDTVYEIREFFHREVYVDQTTLREKRMGHFAEASNDPHRFGYLKRFEDMFGAPVIRSGFSGRGFAHWVGAARVMAALRYRNYVLPEDALKVLLPVLRHRVNFEKGALHFLTSELQLRDTTETTDVVLKALIREAW